MPALTSTPPARASGCCLNPNYCRCSLPCPRRELGTTSGGADWGGGKGGRLFLAPAKISEEASCSVIHLQGQGFLHHNRMLVVIPACVCVYVYIYTHPAVCTLYTRRDTACTRGCTTHRPHADGVGALQHAPAAPAGLILGPGAMAQLPSACTAVPVLRTPARAPATLPCSPVGGLGAGFVPVHSLPQALCRVLVQHSPWGCTMPAEPVPWQEGRCSATSRAEPCALVTSSALGQGPNSSPARAARRLPGQGCRRREKGSPGRMASLRASALPSAVPSAAVTFCHGQRLPQAWLAPRRQAGPGLAAGQRRQLLRMGLQRAAGDFVGGSGLLTLCSPRVVNGEAQLRSCPQPACPSREPAWH